MKNISNDRVGDLVLPFPPVPDQEAILRWIEQETAPAMRAVTRIDEQIGKLTEYRQTLISAAVTGRLNAG